MCDFYINIYFYSYSKIYWQSIEYQTYMLGSGNPTDLIRLPSCSLQMLRSQTNTPRYIYVLMYLTICEEEV